MLSAPAVSIYVKGFHGFTAREMVPDSDDDAEW